MHGWIGYGSQMGAWGWLGPIMMVLFWGLLIVGLVVLIRYFTVRTRNESGTGTSRSGGAALEILRERYARGDIDKAEFEEKKKTLE